MNLEQNIARYIKEKGIMLTTIAKATGIPYMALYDSLFNENRKRKLKGEELIAVCGFLEKPPDVFISTEKDVS